MVLFGKRGINVIVKSQQDLDNDDKSDGRDK